MRSILAAADPRTSPGDGVFGLALALLLGAACLVGGCGRQEVEETVVEPEPEPIVEVIEEPEPEAEPEVIAIDDGSELALGKEGLRDASGRTVQSSKLIVLSRKEGQPMLELHRAIRRLHAAGYYNIRCITTTD